MELVCYLWSQSVTAVFLNNRIQSFLEENSIIVDEQNGFRKDRSCLDHIFTLNSLIQNRQSTFATFVDFRKAFDCVDRNLLQYKLQLNGIDGPMYNAIAGFTLIPNHLYH